MNVSMRFDTCAHPERGAKKQTRQTSRIGGKESAAERINKRTCAYLVRIDGPQLADRRPHSICFYVGSRRAVRHKVEYAEGGASSTGQQEHWTVAKQTMFCRSLGNGTNDLLHVFS